MLIRSLVFVSCSALRSKTRWNNATTQYLKPCSKEYGEAMYRALDEHQFALQEQGGDDYDRCAKIKAWKMIIDAEQEALCLCPFQYAPYRRFGEEVRAQRLIPHLLCELLHNRHRPGKRLVPLLPLPTSIVRFPQGHLDLP